LDDFAEAEGKPAPERLDPGPDPARIVITRKVEYPDTDASGHYQNAAVMRWVQAAEAELHERLSIADRTFGHAPRLHFEVDFLERLWFLDRIEIELAVTHVGRSSARYAFTIRRGHVVAAQGWYAVAHVPRGKDSAEAWPDDLRAALREGGDA
jgi:acyl-CoA thioester hydrolase